MIKKISTDEKLPFLVHLEELRKRIVIMLIAVGVGFGLTFSFSEKILLWLARPLKAKLVFLSPTEVFWVNLKIAFFAGLVLVIPVVLYQVWAFISPGLFEKEKKYALPFVILSTSFFAMGVLFCLFVVLPFAMRFLMTYKTQHLVAVISVGNYVDFVIKFLLAFGLIFELPLAITILAKMGVVTPKFLARNRKYAILINFIIAAILTPTPDIFNQLLMAGPLCLLYEFGIISARIFTKKKKEVEVQTPEMGHPVSEKE